MTAASQNRKWFFCQQTTCVQHKGEFWEEECWLSVSDWKANIKNIKQHFIKIFIKKLRSFYIFYVNMFYLVLLLDIDMLEG